MPPSPPFIYIPPIEWRQGAIIDGIMIETYSTLYLLEDGKAWCRENPEFIEYVIKANKNIVSLESFLTGRYRRFVKIILRGEDLKAALIGGLNLRKDRK